MSNDESISSNISFHLNTNLPLKEQKLLKPSKINLNNDLLVNSNISSQAYLQYQDELAKILEERAQIQKRIKKLDEKEEEEKNLIKKKNPELRQAQLAYCKDPFKYMNYLLEQNFKNVYINNKDDEKIKKLVQEDYDNFQKDLTEDFRIFKNRQKVFLEKLQDKYYIANRKKKGSKILDENAELISQPLYQGEDAKMIFSELPQKKFNLVINSSGDTKNELINNINSKFYKNKLCQGIIQCMGGEGESTLPKAKLVPPSQKFLETNDIKIDRESYIKNKQYFKEQRNKEKEDNEYEGKMIDYEENKIDYNNKFFDLKYKEYQKRINELNNLNGDNIQIISDIKEKMTKDKLFDNLTQTKLNIFKKSPEDIHNILMQKDNKLNPLGFNLDDSENNEEQKRLKEEYFKKLYEDNIKFNNDIDEINKEIEKLKIKKGINKSKKIKRNKSSNINQRKYYNDNPYHYKYGYKGASIPIKKVLREYK